MVEFKDEEFVKKAIVTMNKHDLNGRPLNIKEVGTNYCSVTTVKLKTTVCSYLFWL